MSTSKKLKALRVGRNITIREVELESRRIAAAKGDNRFYISNARLAQLENDPSSEPSLWKVFTLSAVYNIRITELMRLYNIDVEESDKYNAIARPGATRLLSEVPEPYRAIESLKRYIMLDKTTLLPPLMQEAENKAAVPTLDPDSQHIRYGYIGLDDFTMYPLIRPGSFVGIAVDQHKLQSIAWRNEYERPIFFVELRDGYACGWIELQGNQLLLIPHQSSHVSVRRFTYPKEAEILGRVVKFTTPCVNGDLLVQRDQKSQKQED